MKLKYRFVLWLCSGHWKVKAILFGAICGAIGFYFINKWFREMQLMDTGMHEVA